MLKRTFIRLPVRWEQAGRDEGQEGAEGAQLVGRGHRERGVGWR